MQMKLVERDQNLIVITNAAGTEERYDVLANFPFSSDTKRMGIILRHQATKRIVFYLKGAAPTLDLDWHLHTHYYIKGLCV